MIGAGSTVFMKNIVTDLLLEPALKDVNIALHDIDEKRLISRPKSHIKLQNHWGFHHRYLQAQIEESLKHADFVIVMIQVGGYRPSTVIDFDIPAKYGLKQTIADTLGVGGIMRGLRTAPVLIDIAKDMMELCPKAVMLQYANPMAINCLALSRAVPELRYVGLCHSVQGTAADLARDLGEDVSQIDYDCAGINHVAFYTF